MTFENAGLSFVSPLNLEPCRDGERGRGYLRFSRPNGIMWLFPAEASLYQSSLRLYEPYSLGGHMRQLAMRVRVGGQRLCVSRRSLEPLEAVFARALGRDTVRLAFFLNHPGPLGKAVVLVLDEQGEALAIAKLAQQPAGHPAIQNEKRMLEILSGFDDLKVLAPAPLAWLEYGGEKILLTSLGPDKRAPTTFGRLHQKALTRFQKPFLEHIPFWESTMWSVMTGNLEHCKSHLGEPWRERYAWAFRTLAEHLGEKKIAVSLAHRDFTPWNIRLGQGELFVFDWETASQGYPVDYDFFHHHFMTAALLKNCVGSTDVKHWLSIPFAGESSTLRVATLLSYLTDLSLSYHLAKAISTEKKDSVILRHAAVLLDEMRYGRFEDIFSFRK